MIFVFVEDGTLDIIESEAVAQRNYEGIDVESDVYMFYDAEGRYLEPQFTTPNTGGKLLGLIPWRQSGTFRLVFNPDRREDAIGLKLMEVRALNPNPWFQNVGEVKAYLTGKGVPLGY